MPAAALVISPATAPVRPAVPCAGLGFRRKPDAGQRHAGQAEAEFLQSRAACDRLGQALGEFIEFVVHSLNFVALFVFAYVCSNTYLPRLQLKLPRTPAPFPSRGKLPRRRNKSFHIPGGRAGDLGSEHDDLGDLREAFG